MTDPTTCKPPFSATRCIFCALASLFKYCFTKRLAVKPDGSADWPSMMLYEWQRMPTGWRWF